MVVAHTRRPQWRFQRRNDMTRMPGSRGYPQENFQRLADIAIFQLIETIPALARLAYQAAREQFRQMTTGGRRRDTRLTGKITGRPRLAAHQRQQHVGARRISDESGNAGDVRSYFHTLMFIKT